jgi:hypothetical protein
LAGKGKYLKKIPKIYDGVQKYHIKICATSEREYTPTCRDVE